MNRYFFIGIALVALIGVSAWTLAQGQQPGGKGRIAEVPFLVSAAGGDEGSISSYSDTSSVPL